MAFYIITGKLGSGKSLVSVSKIKERLERGCRVATNLDLKLENLFPPHKKDVDVTRLPDLPSVDDLKFLGLGSETHADESKFGLIVLDEGSGNFNAREWADKSRQAMIDWLKHSRKYRWDVYIIVQSANMLDKQIREAFGEHLVICRRMDRLPIPFVSMFAKILDFKISAPKIHLGIVRYGLGINDPVVDRWIYRGTSLYNSYDTEQVFDKDSSPALFSYLSPYHLKGRYMNKFQLAKLMSASYLLTAFIAGLAVSFVASWFYFKQTTKTQPQAQKSPTALLSATTPAQTITGYVKQGNSVHVFLSDGSDFTTQEFTLDASGITVNHNGQQLKQAK
jgi:hypothetical protein